MGPICDFDFYFVIFLQMMNNMGGEDDLPDLDGAEDVRGFSFSMAPIY